MLLIHNRSKKLKYRKEMGDVSGMEKEVTILQACKVNWLLVIKKTMLFKVLIEIDLFTANCVTPLVSVYKVWNGPSLGSFDLILAYNKSNLYECIKRMQLLKHENVHFRNTFFIANCTKSFVIVKPDRYLA